MVYPILRCIQRYKRRPLYVLHVEIKVFNDDDLHGEIRTKNVVTSLTCGGYLHIIVPARL